MPAATPSRPPKLPAAPRDAGVVGPGPAALDAAVAALRTYDRGSSRAALLPIDEAVRAAARDPATRADLEMRLLSVLRAGCPTVATEFICSKLTLIGSERSVPALAALLADPHLATAARTALETLPGRAPDQALRAQLATLTGRAREGVIQSLGARRNPESVRALAKLLRSAEAEVVRATVAALGEIATPRAATVLRRWIARASESLRATTADALLVCAERLGGAGRNSEAAALYQAVAALPLPAHIHQAAQRGVQATARARRPE